MFFGGGPGDGSVFWLGAGALVAIAALLLTVGVPRGWAAVLPLAALAVWCAASIGWSGLPDRSWDYANRTILYALFAALGLWAAARTRALANGLAVVLGAVIVWSLLGKVFPSFYDYGGPDVTRLRGPIGLWNQLALATDYALALALALRGRAGTLLAYSALVALLLTYSRGGILTAALVCVVWFWFSDERVESAATLVAAALPGGGRRWDRLRASRRDERRPVARTFGGATASCSVRSSSSARSPRWCSSAFGGRAILARSAERRSRSGCSPSRPRSSPSW